MGLIASLTISLICRIFSVAGRFGSIASMRRPIFDSKPGPPKAATMSGCWPLPMLKVPCRRSPARRF
ncbi:hypothetical protein D3C72_2015900 [compost metagenome]